MAVDIQSSNDISSVLSQLTSLSNGGDGSLVTQLDPQSISTFTQAMSGSFTDVLSNFLPMLVSSLTAYLGYAVGEHQYGGSNIGKFLDPFSGNNAFTRQQATNAYQTGLINNNAFLGNYLTSLGFDIPRDAEGKPLIAPASNFLKMLPGGDAMFQRTVRTAWDESVGKYGLNPLAMADDSRTTMRAQAATVQAKKLLADVNNMTAEDKVALFGEEAATWKFTSMADVQSAMEKRVAEKGDWTSNEPGDENRSIKIRDKAISLTKRMSEIEGIRVGEYDEDAGKILQGQEDFFAKSHRQQREAAKNRLHRIDVTMARGFDLSPEERSRLETERNQLREQIVALGPKTRFDKMSAAERAFEVTAVADMAVNEAMLYKPPQTEEEEKQLLNSSPEARELALEKAGVQHFMRSTGNTDLARKLITKYSTTLTPESLDNGAWFETIRNAIGGDSVKAGSIAEEIKKGLASTDPQEQTSAIMRAVGYAQQADQVGGDKTGLTGMSKLVNKALTKSGGDSQAAMDAINIAMAYEDVQDITKVDDGTLGSMNRLIDIASKLGDYQEVLGSNFDRVSEALEAMGVSTRDANGRLTETASVMAKSVLEHRAGLSAAGVTQDNAERITTELTQDVAGSENGRYLAGILGLASMQGGGGEEYAKELGRRFSGKSKAQIIEALSNGSDRDKDLLEEWQGTSADARESFIGAGVGYVDQTKHRIQAAAEMYSSKHYDIAARMMKASRTGFGGNGVSDEEAWAAMANDSNLENSKMKNILSYFGITDPHAEDLTEDQKELVEHLRHFDLNDEKQANAAARWIRETARLQKDKNIGDVKDLSNDELFEHMGNVAEGMQNAVEVAEQTKHPSFGYDPDEYNKAHEAERTRRKNQLEAVRRQLRDPKLSDEERSALEERERELDAEVHRLSAPGDAKQTRQRLQKKAELAKVQQDLENPDLPPEQRDKLLTQEGQLLREIQQLMPEESGYNIAGSLTEEQRRAMRAAEYVSGSSLEGLTPEDEQNNPLGDKVQGDMDTFQKQVEFTKTQFEVVDKALVPLAENSAAAAQGLQTLYDALKLIEPLLKL